MEIYEKDIELWKKWKRTKNPADLKALMRNLEPIIQSYVNKWAGVISRETLEIKAKKLVVDALNRYDPKRGVKLSTYVVNSLLPLSRVVYTHQNLIRLPENKVLQLNTFMNVSAELEDELGREPSLDELADRLGWSKKKVEIVRNVFERKELGEEGLNIPEFVFDQYSDFTLETIYHSLTPLQKKIFEYKTGYGGVKPIRSDRMIIQKLKIDAATYKQEMKEIIETIKRLRGY